MIYFIQYYLKKKINVIKMKNNAVTKCLKELIQHVFI